MTSASVSSQVRETYREALRLGVAGHGPRKVSGVRSKLRDVVERLELGIEREVLSRLRAEDLEKLAELFVARIALEDSEPAQLDLLARAERLIGDLGDLKGRGFRGISALLESLMLSLEDLSPKARSIVMHWLSTLTGVSEGVATEAEIEEPKFLEQPLDVLTNAERREAVRGIMNLGLLSEVRAFLSQYEGVASASRDFPELARLEIPTVAVLSRKGGVGKSTIAGMVALWYRRFVNPSARVCVVDLDLTGPVWQYVLFPEINRPAHFLNELLPSSLVDDLGCRAHRPQRKVTRHSVSQCIESSDETRGSIQAISLADLPRTNRYLTAAMALDPVATYGFLVRLLGALKTEVDLVIFDNGPGFTSLPLQVHGLVSNMPRASSIIVSSASRYDLRGSILDISDLVLLPSARPPRWIVNKTSKSAAAFLRSQTSLFRVAKEVRSYEDILPKRPVLASIMKPVSEVLSVATLPFVRALLTAGYVGVRMQKERCFLDDLEASGALLVFEKVMGDTLRSDLGVGKRRGNRSKRSGQNGASATRSRLSRRAYSTKQ